jgi:hypothetical protein
VPTLNARAHDSAGAGIYRRCRACSLALVHHDDDVVLVGVHNGNLIESYSLAEQLRGKR